MEEEVFCKVYRGGIQAIELDRGNTPYVINWTELSGWREKLIENVPLFELHHGFDTHKLSDENPPIDLEILNQLTEKEFSIVAEC